MRHKTLLAAALSLLTATATARDYGQAATVRIWDNRTAPHSNGITTPETEPERDRIADTSQAELYIFPADPATATGQTVVICPGGGYEWVSEREAEPIALKFVGAGYHAVVLHYSVAPAAHYPTALRQLAWTVAHLREHAAEYHIDPNKVVVAGFSAGGHLAASYGVFWKKKTFLAEELGVDAEQLRPNGLLLSYPVITSGTKAHRGSFTNLLGDRYDELVDEMSLENQVSLDTPKTFLWHTAPDDCVPVENSILFFTALHALEIPVEMHIYPVGGHGLGLASEETQSYEYQNAVREECQSWISLAIDWMRHL